MPLSGGRCSVCGSLLAWSEEQAEPAAAQPQWPREMPESAPAPEQQAADPVTALKATLARIVMRGGESPDDPPRQVPPLLPPEPASSTPADSEVHSEPHSTRRAFPTPRQGGTDRTIEISNAGQMPDRASADPPAADLDAPPDAPPDGSRKKPSTFDENRFAQTLESGSAGLAAEETEQVAKLWRGTYDPQTSPRTSLKGSDASRAKARDSRLVIKHRALREVREPARSGAEYELLDVIGEGGMGVVYAARQASIDRTVAVKMLKPDIASHVEQREKFLSEAVVTGDLDHPNIVPIYDLGSNEAGALFYSMKRVQGTPWMTVVDRNSLAANLEILLKVADAVAFAHSRGVIHRDLKPENVMLGDFGEVLVMDWGLALSTEIFRKADSITQTSSMGGTPAYMAPEMATGPIDRVGPASDVYLLGAILFEIIAGKPPHTGKNVMNCLFAAARNEIQQTDQSGELLDLALRAMATKTEDRYGSVQDFQAAIRQYQSHSESIVLSNRAEADLAAAEKSGDYQTYSRALFAFQEAFALWDGNTKARGGISVAKLDYARRALSKEDFDLGASLLDVHDPAHADLRRRIVAAQRERDTRRQRLKNIRRIAAGLGVAVLVLAAVGFVIVSLQRDKAVASEQKAREAELAEKDERDKAVVAESHARSVEKDALTSADRAKKSAELARIAEMQAKSDRDRASQAKEAEEYAAYVARIGLAAAQIDENAFDTAEQLLGECPAKLRNWEWGRLRHLSTQSVRDFEGQAPVDDVAFSTDGRRFVSGSWDGRARIWDVASGRVQATIPYGALYVHAVAFSPDGRLVATGGNDRSGYVKIWNAQTGALVRTLDGHTDDVLSVQFSRDGNRLLTASYDKTARLWDAETGREIRSFTGHNWWVWSAAFSPDESRIVTASQDGTAIVWSVDTAQPGPPFTGHTGPVYAAAFSPDGKSVVSGGYDNRLLIWQPDQVRPFDYPLVVAGGTNPPPQYRALEGHTGPVHTVAFSANGKLVLSGSNDNTLKLWDSASGKLIKSLRGHGGWVDSAVFSPDGHSVLSGSHDNGIKLWSITGYEEVRVLQGRVLQGHTDAVLSAACSRDGTKIVTASRDRTAKVWDFATGNMLQDFEEGHDYLASTAAFFPDGKRLLTAAADNTTRVWDLSAGTQLLRLDRTGRSSVVSLSHDAKLVLSGSDEQTAKLWNAQTGELVRTTKPLSAEVTAVAFSPDDRTFFTGDAHGHCRLWDTQSGAELKHLDTHTDKITSAPFTADGRHVLTASADRTVGQWDLQTGEESLPLILRHPVGVAAVAIVPHGPQAISLGEDGLVRLWDVDRGELLGVLGGEEGTSQIAVSADGRLALWVNYKQRTVRLWDFAAKREVAAPKHPGEPFLAVGDGLVWSAAFSPEAHRILTVGGNGARLWDVASGAEEMSFSPNGAVASARFSPDGRSIVTGSWDNSAKIWDARTGLAQRKLLGHAGYVNSAVFSPDGRLVLTASDDRTARLWDARTGKVVRTFSGHEERVTSAVFSPDGRRVLTASEDKTARIWDTETARQLHVLRGHQWGILSAAFSADGSRVITGSADNTARVWDAETEKSLATLAGHTAPVASVAFSPDGLRALTGSQDNTAKLWDAQTGKEILTLKGHTQEVTSVSFSPDGLDVLTASRDGTAIVWLATDWRAESRRSRNRPSKRCPPRGLRCSEAGKMSRRPRRLARGKLPDIQFADECETTHCGISIPPIECRGKCDWTMGDGAHFAASTGDTAWQLSIARSLRRGSAGRLIRAAPRIATIVRMGQPPPAEAGRDIALFGSPLSPTNDFARRQPNCSRPPVCGRDLAADAWDFAIRREVAAHRADRQRSSPACLKRLPVASGGNNDEAGQTPRIPPSRLCSTGGRFELHPHRGRRSIPRRSSGAIADRRRSDQSALRKPVDSDLESIGAPVDPWGRNRQGISEIGAQSGSDLG